MVLNDDFLSDKGTIGSEQNELFMMNRFVLVKLDHFIEMFCFVSNNRWAPSIVLTLRLGITRPFYIGTKLDTHRLTKQNELIFSEQVVRLALQRTILFMVNTLNLIRIQV